MSVDNTLLFPLSSCRRNFFELVYCVYIPIEEKRKLEWNEIWSDTVNVHGAC